MRRFLPEDASDEEVAVRTVWLARQPIFFVREADALSLPPFRSDSNLTPWSGWLKHWPL